MSLNARAAAFVPQSSDSERSPTGASNVNAPPFQPRGAGGGPHDLTQGGGGPAGFNSSSPPPSGNEFRRVNPNAGFSQHPQPNMNASPVSHNVPGGHGFSGGPRPHMPMHNNYQGSSGGYPPHQNHHVHHSNLHLHSPHGANQGHMGLQMHSGGMPGGTPGMSHHHHMPMGVAAPIRRVPERSGFGVRGPPVLDRRRVVLLMGSPCSGKKTLAERLTAAWPGFVHINGPMSKDGDTVHHKFVYLHNKLTESEASPEVKGYFLTAFTADSEADVHYLFKLLKQHNLEVDYVVYLDLPYNYIATRLCNTQCTSMQMLNHATEYECASKHFSNNETHFSYVQCLKNGHARSTDELFKEVNDYVREVLDTPPSATPSAKLPQPTPMELIHGKWELVDDAMEFHSLLESVDVVIGSKLVCGEFPLRLPGAVLDYPKFARNFHQLKQYHMMLMMNSRRVVIFGGCEGVAYLVQENCTCVYRQTKDSFNLVAKSDGPKIQYVLESELVSLTEATHMLIRDVLFHNGSVHGQLWKQRKSAMNSILNPNETSNPASYVLFHQVHNLANINVILRIRSDIGTDICTGLHFEHNGSYKLGKTDNRNFTWNCTSKAYFVARLWHSKEIAGKGRQDSTTHYTFRLMVVDDVDGCETELLYPNSGSKDRSPLITVPMDQVSEMQLNDGMLVEVCFERKELKTERTRNKDPVPVFRIHRRRQDLLYPSYQTTVHDIITSKPWPEKSLVGACAQFPDVKKCSQSSGHSSN